MELRCGTRFTAREKKILKALWSLGALEAPVSNRRLSEVCGLAPAGIGRTIASMRLLVDRIPTREEGVKWQLKNCIAGTL